MSAMASEITSLTIVYSTVYSGVDQKKYRSSASLSFVRGIHRRPVNFPHKGSVTRKIFPFDDVIMDYDTISAIFKCDHIRQSSTSIYFLYIVGLFAFIYIYFTSHKATAVNILTPASCATSYHFSCYFSSDPNAGDAPLDFVIKKCFDIYVPAITSFPNLIQCSVVWPGVYVAINQKY